MQKDTYTMLTVLVNTARALAASEDLQDFPALRQELDAVLLYAEYAVEYPSRTS